MEVMGMLYLQSNSLENNVLMPFLEKRTRSTAPSRKRKRKADIK